MTPAPSALPVIGVVVVTFAAEDVIAGCLESLMAARALLAAEGLGELRVVVVDNDSPDGTLGAVRGWADGSRPYAPPAGLPFALAPVPRPLALAEGGPETLPREGADLALIRAGGNLGFAGGVNLGLAALARDPAAGHFWVLNPDAMVPAASVAALARRLAQGERYALMGGRVIYLERPDTIQIDGGLLNRRTGVTGNYNLGRPADSTPPDPARLDFVTGASMVASRAFLEAAGPMAEDYFLYYEEVDWAMRRGAMPLAYCPGLVAYHWGGTAIGSPVVGRSASAFSLYFKHRGRIRFLRRFHPAALPGGLAYSLAQAGRLLLRRAPHEAWTVIAASFGLPAPRAVRARLPAEAAARAFARGPR
ncbi:glycosyltransferase [Poseidonocella sp. HB161398]|uniref:glycosyltransferase n=1 Tax=Poseidonocella sp. HB161398 TaxID=2320855 RepID=UPI001107AF65|nr:glycosyltransferase family 2 protein [Poseidonocella sp. HB161398]